MSKRFTEYLTKKLLTIWPGKFYLKKKHIVRLIVQLKFLCSITIVEQFKMAYLLVLMIMLICDSTGQPLYNNLGYEESVDNTLTCYAEFYSKSIILYIIWFFCSAKWNHSVDVILILVFVWWESSDWYEHAF